jgi:amino acid transporter
MLARIQHFLRLWFIEKTGLTATFLILACAAAFAALASFIFLSVSLYAWAAVKLGPVFGALATAGVFLVIAAFCLAAASLSRSRARQRAALERATRSGGSALLDPRVVRIGLEAGRRIGWQRLIPIVLLGFLAAQSVREQRARGGGDSI